MTSTEISRFFKLLDLDLVSSSVPVELPRLNKGDIVVCGLPQAAARTISSILGVSAYNRSDTENGALSSIGGALKTYLERAISDVATNILSQIPDKDDSSGLFDYIVDARQVSPDRWWH